MKPILLALSPHLDDAAFSAGAALAERARSGWRVIIATIFTKSVPAPIGFGLACQLDKGLPPDVDYMALRRQEDEHACEILAVDFLHLTLQEAPHRGYDNASALFAAVHDDDDAQGEIAERLRLLVSSLNPAEIWAPRAVGGHVDHVLVNRGLRACSRLPQVRWWTDFPYIDRTDPLDPEGSALRNARWIDEPITPYGRTRKIAACGAYASQLDFQFGGEAAMSLRLEGQRFERYAETGDGATECRAAPRHAGQAGASLK